MKKNCAIHKTAFIAIWTLTCSQMIWAGELEPSLGVRPSIAYVRTTTSAAISGGTTTISPTRIRQNSNQPGHNTSVRSASRNNSSSRSSSPSSSSPSYSSPSYSSPSSSSPSYSSPSYSSPSYSSPSSSSPSSSSPSYSSTNKVATSNRTIRHMPFIQASATPNRHKRLPKAMGHKDSAEKETGITFMEYLTCSPHRPTEAANTIYLLPMGSSLTTKTLKTTATFLSAFYQLPVRAFQPLDIPKQALQRNKLQYDADWLMNYVERRLPKRAFTCIILTDQDIYTDGLPYVFGLAYADMRTCIVSTSRICSHEGKPMGNIEMMRLFKLTAHEIGHTIGLPHCTVPGCLMDAQATLAELDASTFILCPHCLKKEAWNIAYDPKKRYDELARALKEMRMQTASQVIEEQRATYAQAHVDDSPFGP